MVTFKLISYINGFCHYEIYPEGKEDDKGWLIFNPKTLEVKEKIYPKAGSKYLNKAITGMFDNDGIFKESGMIAWY